MIYFYFIFPQYPQVCFRNHFLFSVLTIIIKSITGIPFYNSNRKKNATMEKALLSHCYSFSLIDYGSIVLLNLKNLLSSVVKINIFYLSFFFLTKDIICLWQRKSRYLFLSKTWRFPTKYPTRRPKMKMPNGQNGVS